ncbi:MAG: ABC transporter ATP-binding protein, partial [Phormidesmis sp.]
MKTYLSKVLYVLTGRKLQLVFLFFIFIFSAFLETIGIGLIGPFLRVLSDPGIVQTNQTMSSLYKQLRLQSLDQFLLVMGVGIIGVFYIKSFFYFQVQVRTFEFSYNQKAKLAKRLLSTYLHIPYEFYLSSNTSNLIKNIIVETNKFCQGILLPILQLWSSLLILLFLIVL